MKKVTSILMAVLVLMTVLHLSFDSHFCGGKLSAVKFSISGEKASCGMENDSESTQPLGKLFKTHCCDDDLVLLNVDSNYSHSNPQTIDFNQKVIAVFAVLLTENVSELAISRNVHPILNPQDVFRKNSVGQSAICVFRI
ncbi:MAG: hypothetical protein GZ094_20390 [Mariniphaga sp.]|nr:hypothetical protein [Mariniphaga sp.]